MVGRGELTDSAWKQLQPLLPANGRRGGQWRDHRQVINGIIWKFSENLHEHHGHPQ